MAQAKWRSNSSTTTVPHVEASPSCLRSPTYLERLDCLSNGLRYFCKTTLEAVNKEQSKKYEGPFDELTDPAGAQELHVSLSIMFFYEDE